MFGFWKVLEKEKKIKENDFFIFDLIMKNVKER